MKKIIILTIALLYGSLHASEQKNYVQFSPLLNESKTPGQSDAVISKKEIMGPAPSDSCPKYKVYVKKVVTSSTRGEISNSGWELKKEISTCDPVKDGENKVSSDIRYITQPDKTEEGIITEKFEKYESEECHASKSTTEVKASFALFESIIKEITDVVNKTPRVELKVSVKPNLTVKKGEECCSKEKPPVKYTEFKGGVEINSELRFTLAGLPDVNESVNLWPFLVVLEMRNKIYAGPYGKSNLEGVGRFYGELGDNTPHPECMSCFYTNFKYEGGVKIGIILGGSVKIFRYHVLGVKKAGYDVTGKPDEEIKAEAEAAVSLGVEINATYAMENCKIPKPGLHGKLTLGKAKAMLRLDIKIGPLSLTPKYEYQLFDGFDFSW